MFYLIAIIVGAVVLDQLTKWLAVVWLQGEPSFPLWQDVLHFTFVKNEGAAFGMLKDHRWIFMSFSVIAIVAMLIYLFGFSPKNRWIRISLAMVIGGGIGNMIDRILLGYVIDFIDFTLIDFAVFNVADCFVTVGAFSLIGLLLIDIVKEEKAARIQKASQNGKGSERTDLREVPDQEATEPSETVPAHISKQPPDSETDRQEHTDG